MDPKKAFNTVDHEILGRKLKMYGLGQLACKWFCDYLNGRVQFTKVNGVMSGMREMKCGVPQGSILGPLVFLVYINDQSKYLGECRTSLYTDNTAVYYSSSSYVDVMLALRIEADNLTQWLRVNKLTLNVAKTKYMLFGTKRKLDHIQPMKLSANNEEIERVTNSKYLGIHLGEALNFEVHLDTLYRKTCSKLGAVKKARNCLNQGMSLKLYRSLVLPHLHYGDLIYMCSTKERLHKLQLIQNIACRIILWVSKDKHVNDMHRELNLLNLDTRRDMHLSFLCHRNIYTNEYASLGKYFNPVGQNGRQETRYGNGMNMKVPPIRSNKGRCSVEFRGPSHWNKRGPLN